MKGDTVAASLYVYRPEVLEALLQHGVRPTERTRPELAREYVRDLYRHELRRLRERLLGGEFPRSEYIGRVTELRDRYPVLALRAHQWVS
jgi:hypothetical protein